MKEQLSFGADAAIIDRLGRELVARQDTALTELIKNSFDADATVVEVVFSFDFSGSSLEIKDNGTGMTREELVGGFLRLASNLKVESPHSPKYRRQRAGRKGIGRFATQRLGHKLVLTTCVVNAQNGLRLSVDWAQFIPGRSLQDVSVELEEVPPSSAGTTIRIEMLRDEWTEAQVRRGWRGVLSLQQPFPVAPIEDRPTSDPGFKVRFVRQGSAFQDEGVVADLQTEILDHLHAVIELKIDGEGHASWSITRNRFGENRPWAAIHHQFPEAADPPTYEHLKNAWMRAHYVILQPDLLPSLVFTRLRDVLGEQGGIRLYRNGFRVVPYGEPGDDWLQLDEIYTRRSFLAPLANRNFFGVIEVRDPEGTLFNEHTSREGLIETPAFVELRELASSVLVTAATKISEDRGRKTRAGSRSPKSPRGTGFDEITAAVRAARDAVESAVADSLKGQLAVEQATAAVKLVEETQEEFAAARAELTDTTAMLRFLATLGMTTAEFSHETGMTFDAFRMDFDAVFEAAVIGKGDDESLVVKARRAKGMLTRLDTLTSYLNALAGARAARAMQPISLSKALQDFDRGIRAQALSQGISLTIVTPPYDPLFTRPMHEAEIASVLLNFYTNAVKAVRRSKGERKILVEGDRVEGSSDQSIRLRFSDTGDGVDPAIRDRVFDAFFSTRVSPPAGASDVEHATGAGLGLWIVHQIAGNAGGSVTVSDPAQGFSTAMEFVVPAEDEGDGVRE